MVANALDNESQPFFLLSQFPFNVLLLVLDLVGGSSLRERSLRSVQAATRCLQLLDECFFTLGFVVHCSGRDVAVLHER